MRRWCHILAVFAAATLASSVSAQETNLPPVATILEKVMEKAKQENTNDRHFRTRYHYVRTRTTRELDSKGRVKKEQTKQSRNNPATVPTSQASPALIPAASVTQTNQSKGFDKNDFILNPDLLSRFDFTLVKREELNGRPAYLLNFKPADKKLPSHGIKDRFINKAAGAIWIDEGDLVLAKTDLYLTEGINVVGGLL